MCEGTTLCVRAPRLGAGPTPFSPPFRSITPVTIGGTEISSYQYARYKARTENEANTFEARCARYFALETTPPDPGVELYATECPCDKLQPDAENQVAGCEFIPFEQLPPEIREARRSTRDIVAHAVTMVLIVMLVLFVWRAWWVTWREDRTRRREEREQAEAEADAMLRSTASGREFVAVKQPDKTLELAEIIVDRDNNENEEDEENEEDDESNENVDENVDERTSSAKERDGAR